MSEELIEHLRTFNDFLVKRGEEPMTMQEYLDMHKRTIAEKTRIITQAEYSEEREYRGY